MVEQNYESDWWPRVYDHWWIENRRQRYERDLGFYRRELAGVAGRVCEGGCGTGALLLPLLDDGVDMVGFDVSAPMLDTLRSKARLAGVTDIESRITQQNLADFRYDAPFAGFIIPSNTFLMLATQSDQIAALTRIHQQLEPGAALLLNWFSLGHDVLVSGCAGEPAAGGRVPWHTWDEDSEFPHPDDGEPIRLRSRAEVDFTSQTMHQIYTFEHRGRSRSVPYTSRWMSMAEFTLLLRLAGFEEWQQFGDANREPFEGSVSSDNSFWIVTRS